MNTTTVYYKIKHKLTGLFLSYSGSLVFEDENKDSEGVWNFEQVQIELK